ncbi:endo-1,4-beta-xylanase 5-like [Impatiens glandulifera]|uniref:endo-1,4-beta-xylanase 5-like n=2 Tax=Impatiens glandulifera TaxID=253017 RepID=UPI001FB0AB40|nr:endo-1,4-beta-xylanase 5-like [Impatiens glandulifera]
MDMCAVISEINLVVSNPREWWIETGTTIHVFSKKEVFSSHEDVKNGLPVDALPYDYSFTAQCLAKPLKPQYGGGIAVNTELDNGIEGWVAFEDSKIEYRVSSDDGNNKFIAAHQRTRAFHSPSQNFFLEKDKIYTFSAWLQVSSGNASIYAIFKSPSGYHKAGITVAQSGCWSMLKGGLSINVSESAQLYFESDNTNTEIWVDSISLQPFTLDEWRSHIDQSVEKERKNHVKLRLVDVNGKPLANTHIKISLRVPQFQFGCASNSYILSNSAYRQWFASKRFTVTTFENEMKWYSTEVTQGREDYTVADGMLNWAKSQSLSVRGHNVLWDDPKYQVSWLNSLSGKHFYQAVVKRIKSIVKRYSGKLIAWDAVNENLHFNYFESRLGKKINLFKMINSYDHHTPLFLNDYNTIEEPSDKASSPDAYMKKIRKIRDNGYHGPLGIGLESHFNTPNLAYMRASIDKLATLSLPIWLTEIDVGSSPDQANLLDQVLKEGHGHPAVEGLVIWAGWKPTGCYRMCLTDNNFNNLPTGNVADRFLRQFIRIDDHLDVTDDMGYFEARLFHGEYSLRVNNTTLERYMNLNETKEFGFNVTNHSDKPRHQVQLITV